MMDEIREGLRYAFQTKNEWTLPLTGTGHVAIEALLANLLEPEDTILIPIFGSWGHLFSEMARRTGNNNLMVCECFNFLINLNLTKA